jgi:hypothetical protein
MLKRLAKVVTCFVAVVIAAFSFSVNAGATVVSPQSVSLSYGPTLFAVSWTGVAGATKYDVEFHPHSSTGATLYGPYLPHWVAATNYSGPYSQLPSLTYGFETVVYSNVANSPKPVRPHTSDYNSKTTIHSKTDTQAAMKTCQKKSGIAAAGTFLAGTLGVAVTVASGGSAAAVIGGIELVYGASAVNAGAAYLACIVK